ncbi:MerR family transcriptional regulator [Thermodesulfovibrio hydrogeniphilus]
MQEPLQTKLPYKLFYKIGEASKLVGVEPSVLRYWETEIPLLKPKKTKTGQRLYTKEDIELILIIKKMLYEEGYTIDGVRKNLSKITKTSNNSSQISGKEDIIEKIKLRLKEILQMLS